jgi:transcriptional regulator with XRE-family HTH domain
MELEIAAQALVPILPVFRQGEHVSRMALGGLAKVYGPVVYSDLAGLRASLTAVLNVVTEDIAARVLPAVSDLGSRLRRHREANGLTITQLAARIGTSEHHLAVLEEAPPYVSNPSLMTLTTAARVLGVPLQQLLGEELLRGSELRESLRSFATEQGLNLDEYRRLEQAAIRAIESDRALSFAEWEKIREARMLAAAGAQQLELLDD